MVEEKTAQYPETNQSRRPPNAPECKMHIEQNRRSATFARGLMRTVSRPVVEATTSAEAGTAYGGKSQRCDAVSRRVLSFPAIQIY